MTIADVVAASGVSSGTVSNYLNRPHLVAPDTKIRIQRAIEELGWVPNQAVRTLRRGRSQLIGLVLSDMSNPFFTDIAEGVEEAAGDAGLSVLLCNSRKDAGREERHMATLAEHRVAGVLMTPVGGVPESQYLSMFERHGIHVVLLAEPRKREAHQIPWVSVDDESGGRMVGEHLGKAGHRNVCFVSGGGEPSYQTTERLRGLREGLGGTQVDATVIEVLATGFHVNDGLSAARNFLALQPRPSAAFLATDLLALGFMRALADQGVAVPDDVAVVGYDDIDLAAVASPALTTVAQPRRALGAMAVQLLLEQLAKDAPPAREFMFAPSLVVRQSG